MLLPHPQLRLSDLRGATSAPSLLEMMAGSHVRQFYNARAVLYHIARALAVGDRRTVLVPAFHCPSVIEPLLRGGVVPRFFRIDRSLQVDLDDVRRQISGDVCAALFINFFGLQSSFEPVLAELRNKGILAIEDCAHSFLSAEPLRLSGQRADVAVYSYWKLVPSSVGGGLWTRPGLELPVPRLRRPPVSDSMSRARRLLVEAGEGLDASGVLGRGYSLALRTRRGLRRLAARSQRPRVTSAAVAPHDEYRFDERLALSRLPGLDRFVLGRADLNGIAASRRRNFAICSSGLGESGLLSKLPLTLGDACPWAYPCVLRDRSAHDRTLRKLGVPVWTFGNVLHRALTTSENRAAAEDARFLADNLLSLPVHQMLSSDDVGDFVGTINGYCAGTG